MSPGFQRCYVPAYFKRRALTLIIEIERGFLFLMVSSLFDEEGEHPKTLSMIEKEIMNDDD